MADRESDIKALVARLEPSIRKAYIKAVEETRSRASIRLLEDTIRRGDLTRLVSLLQPGASSTALLEQAVQETVVAGGGFEARKAPVGVFRFSGQNERAQRIVREQGARLVTKMVEGQRDALAEVMTRGLVANRNPRKTALDMVGRIDKGTGRRTGGVLGLNGPQAEYVERARSELGGVGRGGKGGNYFSRERRDRRFDKMVRRSIDTGKPLTSEQVERITGRYSDRLLQLRAETISRETVGIMNKGRSEALDQMVEEGLVEDQDTKKTWHSTGDSRDRDTHAEMDGQERQRTEPFTSPSGARMMEPGDTELGAGPEETTNCRCYMSIEIDFIAQRRRQRALERVSG